MHPLLRLGRDTLAAAWLGSSIRESLVRTTLYARSLYASPERIVWS